MPQKKVLVVDDNPDILDSLRLILEFEDYEVETMMKGSAVFLLPPEDYPDIILLDMWLSGEDGRDICRGLKSDEAKRNIPVIIMSASHGLEESTYEAGADAFISKPFDIAEMLTTIQKLVA